MLKIWVQKGKRERKRGGDSDKSSSYPPMKKIYYPI